MAVNPKAYPLADAQVRKGASGLAGRRQPLPPL